MNFGHRYLRLSALLLVSLGSGCAGAGQPPALPAPEAAGTAPGPSGSFESSVARGKVSPAATTAPTPTPPPAPTTLKVGAYVAPNASASPGLSSIATLETALGRKLDYDLHYYPLTYKYPGADLEDDAANGRTPIISLKCNGDTNAEIASGSYDAQIDAMATALAAYGNTVVIRYLWEMNSKITSNYPADCAGPDDTNGYFNASDYIAAWDHLRARFILDGATNVKWFWCPDDDANTLPPYFPGASEVDYIGVDIYARPSETYTWYTKHAQAVYASIVALAPGLPFIVGETGTESSEQVTFFNSLQSLYATMPAITAWVYLDGSGALGNWEVQPGTAEFAAFKNAANP